MRIHLAGNAPTSISELGVLRELHGAHPHRLQSYLDMHKDPAFMPTLRLFNRGDDHLLDSGLFSFLFGSRQGEIEPSQSAFEEYGRRYLADVQAAGIVGPIVELDAHAVLGMEAVRRLRRMFRDRESRTVFVWHVPETLDGLLKLAEEKSYIAISVPELRVAMGGMFSAGSPDVGRAVNDLLRRVHEHCRRRGVLPPRIHLLGCTSVSVMSTRLAYSCDSTSWLSGVRYGSMPVLDSSGAIRSVSIRSPAGQRQREVILNRFPALAAAIVNMTAKQQERHLSVAASAFAFARLQQHLDQKFPSVEVRRA